MRVTQVWSVWFSPTGTTRRVVTALSQSLAQGLDADWKEYSFNLPPAREKALSFSPEDLVVLGVPVYAGRVPNLMLPYIRDRIRGNGALAVPVVLFGNRSFDDGLMELRCVMQDNGFHPVAAAAIVGAHAMSDTLGAGRPDGEDMALVDQLARRTLEKLRALTEPPAQAVEVDGCDPVRPYFTPRDRNGDPIPDFLKAKPTLLPELCTRCGACARLCPLHSIDPEEVSRVPGKCIKCCACVKGCPTGARRFDHPAFLYHARDLEALYGGRRAQSRIFL